MPDALNDGGRESPDPNALLQILKSWLFVALFLQFFYLTIDTVQDFFGQVGHQAKSVCIENKHFFTESCHPQSWQNLYFQSDFLASKINRIFLIFFCEEYLTKRSSLIFKVVCTLFSKMYPIFVCSVHNFGK